MRTVYACVLEVAVKSPETSGQGFERLWNLTTQWVESLYKERWNVECRVAANQPKIAPVPFHGVLAQRENMAGVCELASLEWSYPDDQDVGLQWIIVATLARNGPRLEASVNVRIVSTHPIAKPLSYNLKRPTLVDKILQNFACSIGKSPIPLKPRELVKDEVEPFVDDILCSPDRWLPIVTVSPEQGIHDYLVDPVELQQTLLGHAQVVNFRDSWASRAWTEALTVKELSCYLGAVRLYWPGFTRRSKPADHPLHMADTIRWRMEQQQQPLGQYLFRTLVAVSGFRFSNPPIARLVREAIDNDTRARFMSMVKNAKAHEESGQILQELERAWDQIKLLQQEKDEARNQIAELTRELEAQKEAWQGFRGQRAAAPTEAPAPRTPPRTVSEAAERAREDFARTLTFLPDALESARQSPYRDPDKVYALFQALDELTRTWQQKGSIGLGWHDALKPKGFDYAEFISPTAKGKFGNEYTFQYEGRPTLCEKHVTLGARSADTCISIHWHRDEARKRLVIGWCGKHLSNTQS